MSTKPVTTKTASLETMSVNIQALHVDGKQMTLSVFKQLPKEPVSISIDTPNDKWHWWGYVRVKDGEYPLWLIHSVYGTLYREGYWFSEEDKLKTLGLTQLFIAV